MKSVIFLVFGVLLIRAPRVSFHLARPGNRTAWAGRLFSHGVGQVSDRLLMLGRLGPSRLRPRRPPAGRRLSRM